MWINFAHHLPLFVMINVILYLSPPVDLKKQEEGQMPATLPIFRTAVLSGSLQGAFWTHTFPISFLCVKGTFFLEGEDDSQNKQTDVEARVQDLSPLLGYF